MVANFESAIVPGSDHLDPLVKASHGPFGGGGKGPLLMIKMARRGVSNM
jgi:hypothetical protein